MKLRLSLIGVLSAACLSSHAYAESECGTVVITEMNWASGAVVTAVSSFLMEQGYGCEVEKVMTSTVPALTSLAETGKPDILTEIWPGVADVYYSLEQEGKIVKVGDVLSDGGQDGWWVPQYVVDEHPEVATLEGIMANPELVGAKFNNGPSGWGARVSSDNLIEAFGLDDHGIEIFNHGSGETLAASMASAYESKEPWFGYYWAPTALLGKYPMVSVDMGPVDVEKAKCNSRVDCPTPGKTGWPSASVLTTMSKTFYDANPAIVELMSKVSFTNTQMGELLAWQEENEATADETAAYFLMEYQDVWKDWLSADAASKLNALFQ